MLLARRLTFLILLCVVFGAAMNLAVAWGLALVRQFPMYPRPILGSFVHWDRPWYVSESQITGIIDVWWAEIGDGDTFSGAGAAPEERVMAMRAEQEKIARDDDRMLRNRPRSWGTFTREQPPERVQGADMGFGWPTPSMWFQLTAEVRGNTMLNDELHGGWLLIGQPSAVGRDFRAVPLRPIWWGWLINAPFWALIWLVLLLAPDMIRRHIRRRRGCCAACGYDLRGSAGKRCPECGSERAVRPSAASAQR